MTEERGRQASRNEGTESERPGAADFVIGYFTCPQDAAKSFLGALLLTDGRTRPLHFAYVLPVRPTTMQRIIYGKTLDAHIKLDVIARKLVREGITRVPQMVFVDADDLLSARAIFGVPTARLGRIADDQRNPTTISVYQYCTGGNAEDEAVIGQLVDTLEREGIDLIDPFDRIREALKEALKKETR